MLLSPYDVYFNIQKGYTKLNSTHELMCKILYCICKNKSAYHLKRKLVRWKALYLLLYTYSSLQMIETQNKSY